MKTLLLILLFASISFGQNLLLMDDDVSYEAEATALFARMTGLSATDKDNINTLIAGLKEDGNWAELDYLRVYATNSSANALLNWTEDAHNGQLVGLPTFTAYKGFTGNGTDTGIDGNYNPSTQGVNFTLDDNSFGVWILTDVTEARADIGAADATQWLFIYPRYNNTRIYWGNCNTLSQDVNFNGITTSVGFTVSKRVNSTQTQIWKDGLAKATTTAQNSLGLPNADIHDLCLNAAGAPTSFSTKQIAVSFAGSGSTDVLKLYNRLLTYLQVVGAVE